jgi:hypothetical protein
MSGSSRDAVDKPLNIRRDNWELVSACQLIRELQPEAHRLGWNLMLGGGVLNNGYSFNDLDVVAIPRSTLPKPDEGALLNLFKPIREAAAFTLHAPLRVVHQCQPRADMAVVEVIVISPHQGE